MGSDMYMNPPKEVFDTFRVKTDEEVIDYVIGALATGRRINITPAKNLDQGNGLSHRIDVSTGRWI